MNKKNIQIGDSLLKINNAETTGSYVTLEGEEYYKIENYHKMPPFFMSMVSNSDHWMFISSNGALTAGRKNPDHAIFPYYTDDKIADTAEITGNKTILIVQKDGITHLWEPFSSKFENLYNVKRNLYKNTYGNKLIFEEINLDLELSFTYGWYNSEKYGFIKKSSLKNHGKQLLNIELVDGVQNILPFGVERILQNRLSTLVEAYKKNELIVESGIGIYSLSSIITDKAEPSEALMATTVWSTGMVGSKKLISSRQLDNFRKGLEVFQEEDIRAARGAYFDVVSYDLKAGDSKTWFLVIESCQDIVKIITLQDFLNKTSKPELLLTEDINLGTENLIKIVANADGLQITEDVLTSSRHFSNVLFNIMRGGIFDDNYTIDKSDFACYIKQFNKALAAKYQALINLLDNKLKCGELLQKIDAIGNADLLRLSYEYLPLTFSRRHGDPSRPWNIFSIDIKNEDGSKFLFYQGNWRDIFQNWESLSLSFPCFIESMICKFVNASTADGYNPYHISRDGIAWEIIIPDDPWSNIGYWGDHQIVYLLKFLENSQKYHPGKLNEFLAEEQFVYANVPYRIKTYDQILSNPKKAIDFDNDLDGLIQKRVKEIGADGKLLLDNNNETYKVNLTEKILVPLLTKLTNFIPEAGIWLNTQRPEWNDANNALVGNGVSMVTLYYMRRYMVFCKELFSHSKEIKLSQEVLFLINEITKIFIDNEKLLTRRISDKERKMMLDLLGQAGSTYREAIYNRGFCGNKEIISAEKLKIFLDISLDFVDHSITANRRTDNLFHSYNLIKVVNGTEIQIRHLYEMLEGQVAILSSSYLGASEAIQVLDALKNSKMFRADQYSYMLYPDRQLKRFMEKNSIPENMVKKSELFTKLVKDGNRQLIQKDVKGDLHFHSSFRNSDILKDSLNTLKNAGYKEIVEKEYNLVLDIYETVFDHQSFTGRSGTFYGYEGLGSIYWHMVSKLVLAIGENYFTAFYSKADQSVLNKLITHFHEAKAGMGAKKTPAQYGAFPTDPYSHTPKTKGAQQPGMTGQVKEDILSRFVELGVSVENGTISFKPGLLGKEEFLVKASDFAFYDQSGIKKNINLIPGTLAFTFCQVPIIYKSGSADLIEIKIKDQKSFTLKGNTIDAAWSKKIFDRDGEIESIMVSLIC